MRFDTFVFAAFFVLFAALYWGTKSRRVQNVLILLGSYVFYGWWDWRFLFLMALSTIIDYTVANRMEHAAVDDKGRKRLLYVSIAANLGILGMFKYFDFFVGSFVDMMNGLGVGVSLPMIEVILPVGISFYTFQTLGYTVDVYRRRHAPADNLLAFGCYVAFFPQLVAGPIERASRLLPQFGEKRTLTRAMWRSGFTLVVFGLVKKIAIADNMAPFVDWVYNPATEASGPLVFVGTIAFAIQIYADFSGYTDIARGVARLLGFELCVNFNKPYVAISPSDFWRRWHISLSQWLRDYLYIPLGGNRGGSMMIYRNLMLTMLLGGLWHGASWNFVIWGFYHGAILCVYRFFNLDSWLAAKSAGFRGAVAAPIFFLFTLYGWLLFRAHTWEQIAGFTTSLFTSWGDWTHAFSLLLVVGYFSIPIIVHHILATGLKGEKWQPKNVWAWRGVLAAVIIYGVFHARASDTAFIYFQF